MVNKKTRQLVSERAYGCCEYCMSQENYATQLFSVEHIFPLALGGNSDLDNLALSCQGCNNFKFIKLTAFDNETKALVPIFNPRIDIWTEHFRWNERFTVILGITPVGRATIQALRLNRDILINQRIVFRKYGIHPPEQSLL